MLRNAGFEEAELVAETGYNSSPKTKGVLVRAIKPANPVQKKEAPVKLSVIESRSISRQEDIGTHSNIDALLQKATEWGAEKAKLIDTDTIVVEKWVRWKCLYGCPMYEKDGYHPPVAPGTEETREVLGEYANAILLNSTNGTKLTEIAVKLEAEAYHAGYYKAFAMTALASGSGDTSKPGAT